MSAATVTMELRSIRLEPDQIGYLKWLLESHDGLATPTTREGAPDIVDLMVAPDFVGELDALIDALAEEIALERVATPRQPPL